jgi:O-antigen ligase
MKRPNAAVLPVVFVLFATVIGLAASLLGPLALIVVPAALGGFLLFFNPTAGVALLVFTIPLEAVFLVGGNTITKLVGAFVVLSWTVVRLLRQESWWPLLTERWIWAAMAFVGLAGVSLWWAEYFAGVQGQLQRLVLLLALAVVMFDLLRSWNAVEWIVRVLVLSGMAAALLTVSQTLSLGVRRAGEGVTGGINATAMALVTLMPFGFYLVRSPRERTLWRVIGVVYLGLAVLGVTSTLSRMGFLLIPLVFTLVLWESLRTGVGRTPLAIMVAVTVIAGVAIIPADKVMDRIETIGPYVQGMVSPDDSLDPRMSGRGYHMKVALAIFADHPVRGVGYANYGSYFRDRYQFEVTGRDRFYLNARSAHSSYPLILAELGIPGLLLWGALLFLASRGLWRGWLLYRGDPASQRFMLTYAIGLAFVVQLLIGFYDETHTNKFFWLILGLVLAAGRLVDRDANSRPRLRRRGAPVPLERSPPRSYRQQVGPDRLEGAPGPTGVYRTSLPHRRR